MLTKFICPVCGEEFEAFLPQFRADVSRNLPLCPNSTCNVPVDEEDIDKSTSWRQFTRLRISLAWSRICGACTAAACNCRFAAFWTTSAAFFLLFNSVKYATLPAWGPTWLVWDRLGRPFRRKPWFMSTKQLEYLKVELHKAQMAHMNQEANDRYYEENKDQIEAGKRKPWEKKCSITAVGRGIAPLTEAEKNEIAARTESDPIKPTMIKGVETYLCPMCQAPCFDEKHARGCCSVTVYMYKHACTICGKQHLTADWAYKCCRESTAARVQSVRIGYNKTIDNVVPRPTKPLSFACMQCKTRYDNVDDVLGCCSSKYSDKDFTF